MIALEVLRHEPERLRKAIADKGIECDLDSILVLDKKRRVLIQSVERIRARQWPHWKRGRGNFWPR